MRLWLLPLLVPAALAGPDPDAVDRIFAGFHNRTPGCAVGVAHEGRIVHQAGYGMADLERLVPITPESVFESGSVAKQFTAAALMLLAQRGTIALDDPMRKYLPELPDYGTPLTIRHVIHHISGLREWRPLAAFSGAPEGTRVYSNADLLYLASRQKGLNFDPGTAYSYSNTGFNIATILIERALGGRQTFEEFTREAIFQPLGMTQTRWRADFRAVVPRRALAYSRQQDGWRQSTPIENIIGAGGMLTTVRDLLSWNENFTHARVGGAEFVKAQQTPARLANGREITYAAGLMVTDQDGSKEVSHGGATGGYRTWLGRYPDRLLSVAVLCNSAEANAMQLGRRTAQLWLGPGNAEPASTGSADAAQLGKLTGMYRRVRDNTVLELRLVDGRLVDGDGAAFRPLAAGTFSYGSSLVHFSEGAPPRLRVVEANGEVAYEKVEPATPTASDLAAYAGEYRSEETGTVVVTASEGRLSFRAGRNAPVPLRPTFRDAFAARDGSSIRFLRDPADRVAAMSAGEGRVWDLRFVRVAAGAGRGR